MRSQRSAIASPVLVGAVTTLVTLVAVFLAYNANRGLPFVPTKELKVDIPNGSNVVAGNDVREGGFRIGLVNKLRPIELRNGSPGAELTLKLDKSHSRIPTDSTATILSRSVLGLKYVDIVVGHSRHVFPDGGVIPVTQTSVPVQFDDVYKTFNAPTRRAIEQNLVGYGDAFAARGSALNDTIASLPAFLGYLRPVAHYLADEPHTGLIRFFRDTDHFVAAIAPVAATNVQLFADQATTWAAIDRSPSDYRLTIAESPPTLDVSTTSLRTQLPFLRDFTTFGRALGPGTAALRHALPIVTPAIEIGTKTLARTPTLNAETKRLLAALRDLALSPGTDIALNGLSDTVGTLNPMVKYLGPYVTVCNDWNYWWTFLSEHLSESTAYGFAQRALINTTDGTQPDNLGSIGATEPAAGQPDPTGKPGPEYAKGPAYGAAVDTHGYADCENGQRGYLKHQNYYDPLKRDLDSDPHTPGDQGPTYTGRPRVPAGETFSRAPLTGPQLAFVPGNN